MPAGKQDIYIESGATWSLTFTWRDSNGNPINLTGYSARMQIRPGVEAEATIASLTDGSGLTLGGAAGTIVATLSATATAAITATTGVYDLELQDGDGVVTRLVEGAVTISPEVTR